MAEVYVYELMDYDGGNKERERKWDILSENMTRKCNVEFSSGAKNSGSMGIFLVIMWFLIWWFITLVNLDLWHFAEL